MAGKPLLEVKVKVSGAFFEKKRSDVVRRALMSESIGKISARFERGGRGLGARRNTVRTHPHSRDLSALVSSTRGRFPRMTGSSWVNKNYRTGRAMAPRVLNAGAKRAAVELGGRG